MLKKIFSPPSLKLRRTSKILKYLPQIFALLFILAFAVFAWQEPSQNPPQGNVPSPINVGPTEQTKEGNLIIKGIFQTAEQFLGGIIFGRAGKLEIFDASSNKNITLDGATGDVSANRFCLKGNCKSEWEVFTFMRTFDRGNEWAYSTIKTSDGGYIMAGYTEPPSYQDLYLVKTDSLGNKLWESVLPGSDVRETGYSVVQTSDGGYIVAGSIERYVYTVGYQKDFWLVKTDAWGNKEWDKYFGEAGFTQPLHEIAYSVVQTSDGGYIVGGSKGENSDWVIRTNSSGAIQWEKTLGGTGAGIRSIQITSDGNYILAGGGVDGKLWKIDNSGNIIWSKSFGGSYSDIFRSVALTSDGGYIAAGASDPYGNTINYNFWLVKTDGSGNKIWEKTLGLSITNDAGAYSVSQTFDGGYIVAGLICANASWAQCLSYDARLIKTNSSGNKLWEKTFGGSASDYVYSVSQTFDGGYILGGATNGFGGGGVNFWLIKTDAQGNVF